MNPNIIDEIKKLEIVISKKLFKVAKDQEIKNPPSPLQARILKYLIDHINEIVCQKNLEEKLHVSKATISEAICAMEKNRIIKRVSLPEDGRAKRILLTDTSLERLHELEKNFLAINEKLIKGINDQELAHFLNILNKMQKNVNEEGE